MRLYLMTCLFFSHQVIIITFQAKKIHCFVETAVKLGKLIPNTTRKLDTL